MRNRKKCDAKSMKRRGSMSGLFRGEVHLSVLFRAHLSVLIVGYIGLR